MHKRLIKSLRNRLDDFLAASLPCNLENIRPAGFRNRIAVEDLALNFQL